MVESPSLNSFETYKVVARKSEKCERVNQQGWKMSELVGRPLDDVPFWCTGWLLACIETPYEFRMQER
jgi:hypothetical protein